MEKVGSSSPKRAKRERSFTPARCRRYKYEAPPADPALCCLDWLPDEIHVAILGYLHPAYATLPVRETCARWRRIMPSLLPPDKLAALPSRPRPRVVRHLVTNTYGEKLFMLYVQRGKLNLLRYHFSNTKILGNWWDGLVWKMNPIRTEDAFLKSYGYPLPPKWVDMEESTNMKYGMDALGNYWNSVSWIIGPERPSPELLEWLHYSKRMPITERCLEYILRHRRRDLLEMECVRNAHFEEFEKMAILALKCDCMEYWGWLWKTHLRKRWETDFPIDLEVTAVIRAALMYGRFQAVFDIIEARPPTAPVWRENIIRIAEGALETQHLNALDFLHNVLVVNGLGLERRDIAEMDRFVLKKHKYESYRWLLDHYKVFMKSPNRDRVLLMLPGWGGRRTPEGRESPPEFFAFLFETWPQMADGLRREDNPRVRNTQLKAHKLKTALIKTRDPELLSLFCDRGVITIDDADLINMMGPWGERLTPEFVDKVTRGSHTTTTT